MSELDIPCVLRISVILLVALWDFEIIFGPHIDLFGVAARLFTLNRRQIGQSRLQRKIPMQIS